VYAGDEAKANSDHAPKEKGGMPALQSVSHEDWVRQAYPQF